jgi:two-component system sensor histidine kinase KdpD
VVAPLRDQPVLPVTVHSGLVEEHDLMEGSTEHGRLRVYLGAAPGVGKTFAMLNEGHRRAERGTDVVIGFVETHGRAKTEEAVGDLEVVPRRTVTYHGLTTTEMDLTAVLARRPDVALVDELAHSNVADPGDEGAHTKRWQDVQDLLDAGIDVITTVNVQHLESLNDVVESITGIRQTETVPDAVVRAADAVELVDMSPQSLRRRMAHGNIYSADKVDTALSRYFREGNLAALRELALLWLADRVDEGLDRYRDAHGIDATWATRERVVVAVSGAEESSALMRRAVRIATRSAGGEWLAVYVTRRDGLSGVSPDSLETLRTKAHDLGGSFHAVVASDVAEGLLDFARGVNATQVLVGASRRSRLSALLRPGVGEVVIAESGDIDVHVVTHAYARRGHQARGRRASVGRDRLIWGYLMAVLGTALLVGTLYLTPDLHGLPTEAMVLMAMVVATALVGGLFPAVVAALVGSFCLNLLFIQPYGTLEIADPENVFAIVVFLLVGVAVASVVDRAARMTQRAVRARAEANALSVLSHSLLHLGESPSHLLAQACEVFGMTGGAVLRAEPDGSVAVEASYGEAPSSVATADADIAVTSEVTLVFRGRPLDAADRTLLTAYAAHFTVMRERQRALLESRHAAELADANRTRTALLAAVSHDLRSPLSAIKAAVSSLRNTEITWSAQDEAELLGAIEDSADRLDSLVGNLLDMSRLQMGTINPLVTELDLISAVEWALGPIPGSERVEVALGSEPAVAQVDPGLLDRVIANVVENALRHTPEGTRVQIQSSAWTDQDLARWVSLRIVDHGPGIPAASRDALFAPFQRLGDVPNGDGLGLGLAVARGLTEAMGGNLTAEETPGGGLTMVIDLPASPPTPAVRPELQESPR